LFISLFCIPAPITIINITSAIVKPMNIKRNGNTVCETSDGNVSEKTK
jgi:hypothetical protein